MIEQMQQAQRIHSMELKEDVAEECVLELPGSKNPFNGIERELFTSKTHYYYYVYHESIQWN